MCPHAGQALGPDGRRVYPKGMPEYATLRDKIAAEKEERYERYKQFRAIYEEAQLAGRAAGELAVPEPMVIVGYEHEPVNDVVCGFAWVNVRPGNSSFDRKRKQLVPAPLHAFT